MQDREYSGKFPVPAAGKIRYVGFMKIKRYDPEMGERLQIALKRAKLTKIAASRQAGFGDTYARDVCSRGSTTPENLERLIAANNLPAEYILTGKTPPSPKSPPPKAITVAVDAESLAAALSWVLREHGLPETLAQVFAPLLLGYIARCQARK